MNIRAQRPHRQIECLTDQNDERTEHIAESASADEIGPHVVENTPDDHPRKQQSEEPGVT